MRIVLIASLFAATLGASIEARAVGPECDSPREGSTLQESCFLQSGREESDRLLNSTYKELLLRWKGADSKRERDGLIVAQRAWINFRDKTCSLEQAIGGGMLSINYSRCLSRLTSERVEYLNKLLNGDLEIVL